MSATNHALVKDSVVDNVVVLDIGSDEGAAWLEAVSPNFDTVEDVSAVTPAPGIGWIRKSTGSYLVPQKLASSTLTLAANGSNHATVTFTDNTATPPAYVTFDVNGATTTEATSSGVAVITVTASAGGPIVVSCEGLTVTLEAS